MPVVPLVQPASYRSAAMSREQGLRTALARCEALSAVVDNKGEAELLEHITVGHVRDAWSQRGEGEATRDDLDRILCRAYLVPHEEQPNGARRSDEVAGCPEVDSMTRLRVRRQMRDADVSENSNGRAGVFNAFRDVMEQLPYQLIEQAQGIGDVAEIDAVILDDVFESDVDEEVSQGPHLTALFSISFLLEGGAGP